MSVVGKLIALSSGERLLYAEAWLQQLYTGLVLKIIPFRRIAVLFAVNTGRENAADINMITPGILLSIRNAILSTTRYTPWKNRCLVQSLAARRMLNHRRIFSQLSLGLAKEEGDNLIAHAWITAGDFEIVARNGDYKELFVF